MALTPPSPSAPPAENFARFGEAFSTIDNLLLAVQQSGRDLGLVQQGAASTAVGLAGLDARVAQNQADAESRFDGLGLADEALSAALDAAVQEMAAQRYAQTEIGSRPGEGDLSFTLVTDPALLSGSNGALPPLPGTATALGDNGRVARLRSAGVVGARRSVAIEPGRVYRARFVVQRRTNSSDPSNDAVRLGLAWLDQARNVIPNAATVVLDIQDLRVQDGRQVVSTTFARSGGDGILLIAPATARHARAFVQVYGADGATDVEVVDLTDITDLTIPAPIATNDRARIAALESGDFAARIGSLEASTQNPNSQTYATRTAAAAASVPASVTTLVTRGLTTAGDGLSAEYRRIGSATGSDFRSADGAYWARTFDLASAPGAGSVNRRVLDRLFDQVKVKDYLGSSVDAALAAAVMAAGSLGAVLVENAYTPTASVGTVDTLWLRSGLGTLGSADRLVGGVIDMGAKVSTDAYRTPTSTAGGFFADYDCNGLFRVLRRQSEDQTGIAGGGFRDAAFFNHLDTDDRNYVNVGQKVSYGVRGLATGSLNPQTKDIVGGDFHAVARITGWDARGVSGVTTGAVQLGSGIASNEFAVQNPADSFEQSSSMIAVQGILRNHKGAADPTTAGPAGKYARLFLGSNNEGYPATAGLELTSAPHASIAARDASFSRVIELLGARAKDAAIRMPQSAPGAGDAGTLIEYNANCYSAYTREAELYYWVIGGAVVMSVNPTGLNLRGLNVGSNILAGANFGPAHLFLGSSTADKSSLRIGPGVQPSAPASGDIWFDGDALRLFVGGTVKTFVLQ